jgi:hypothetical protein
MNFCGTPASLPADSIQNRPGVSAGTNPVLGVSWLINSYSRSPRHMVSAYRRNSTR